MNDALRRELLPEMIRDTLRRIERWLRRLFWLAMVVWVVWPTLGVVAASVNLYQKQRHQSEWTECMGLHRPNCGPNPY